MKVLHVVGGSLDGGAARGAVVLHEALLKRGVDSTLLCSRVLSNCSSRTYFEIEGNSWRRCLGFFYRKINSIRKAFYRRRKRDVVLNIGLLGADIQEWVRLLSPDILHLHWIGQAVMDIRKLDQLNIPVVWTLRDMWPVTGGCHYSLGCESFRVGCGKCPQLGSSSPDDITSSISDIKKNIFRRKKVEFVGISTWLTHLAESSYVLSGLNNTRTISNAIDTDVFFPSCAATARQRLGLPLERKIVAVGAQSLRDSYKGFSDAIRALNAASKEIDFLVVLFGKVSGEDLSGCGFEWKSLGFIKDDQILRDIYSASDVFLAPSRMEAFGKTIAEAMACGTPVACYGATGPKDIVIDGVTGVFARHLDATDLGTAVCRAFDLADRPETKDACQRVVLEKFSNVVAAKKYEELYRELLS